MRGRATKAGQKIYITPPKTPSEQLTIAARLAAWEKERAFISQLIEQGPVPGQRTWAREELYEQKL
jgi:hypothetical protein